MYPFLAPQPGVRPPKSWLPSERHELSSLRILAIDFGEIAAMRLDLPSGMRRYGAAQAVTEEELQERGTSMGLSVSLSLLEWAQ